MTREQTLTSIFRRTARWYADEPGFVQHETGRTYSYGAADDLACRFANALLDAGVTGGDRVGFLSQSRADHAICYFGAQKLGAVPTTLHQRESVGDVVRMVEDVEPAAFVFQAQYGGIAGRVRDANDGIDAFVTLGDASDAPAFATEFEAFVEDAPATEPDEAVEPEDPGVIVFSSGTTGRPKGVVHTHENLVWACHLGQYFYEVRDSDAACFPLAPSFVAWQDQVLSWVGNGAKIVFRESFDPPAILDLLESESITSVTLVPTHWERLFEAGLADRDLDSLRVVGYSGAVMSEGTLAELQTQFPDAVFTAYGSTETLNAVTKLTPERVDPETPEKVGRPIASVDVRIVDPDAADPTATVDPGDIGEIIMTGPCLTSEIWRDEAATAETIRDGWWFSGDLGRIGPDGSLYLEGRTDNMIISGGINIYGKRIESILETHEAVTTASVLGVPDEEWGEIVAAFVVPDRDVTEGALDAWCKDHDDLGSYQRPRQYVFLDEMPMTSTGKRAYDELRTLAADR